MPSLRNCLLSALPLLSLASASFVHPGLLLTSADIARVTKNTASGTVAEAWTAFKANQFSNVEWTLQGPDAVVKRDTAGSNDGNTHFMNDAQAAWQLAVRWVIGKEEAAAKKSLEIIEAWGSTLKTVDGSDAQLAASLSGSNLVQAAELIRSTYNASSHSGGWTTASITTFSKMLNEVLLPPVSQTKPSRTQKYPCQANWGTSAEKALIAIGIFTNNRATYEFGKELIDSSACSNLTGNIAASGQSSESGRDQQHTQLGLGNLAEAFQMLYNQGEDFFAHDNNRLMAGLEYTATYLNGEDVDFDATFQRCDANLLGGPWSEISSSGRDDVRPVYELGYAHYVSEKNLDMPNTEKLIQAHAPDGENPINSVTDGSGFQTLLFRIQ